MGIWRNSAKFRQILYISKLQRSANALYICYSCVCFSGFLSYCKCSWHLRVKIHTQRSFLGNFQVSSVGASRYRFVRRLSPSFQFWVWKAFPADWRHTMKTLWIQPHKTLKIPRWKLPDKNTKEKWLPVHTAVHSRFMYKRKYWKARKPTRCTNVVSSRGYQASRIIARITEPVVEYLSFHIPPSTWL